MESTEPAGMVSDLMHNRASCLNCDAELRGEFCWRCGQQVREVKKPFLAVIQQMLFILFDLDGRAWRTVFLLLTRPGHLSKQYVNGRRASYTPPLKLFLVTSIAFIVIITVTSTLAGFRQSLQESEQQAGMDQVEPVPGSQDAAPGAISAASGDLASAGGVSQQSSSDSSDDGQTTTREEIRAAVQSALADGDPDSAAAQVLDGLDLEELDDVEGNSFSADFSLEDRDELIALIDEFRLGFLSENANENLRQIMRTQAVANYDALVEDPVGTALGALEYTTFFMLVMMPILALIQKILLVGRKRFYVEHMVLTLHNHTFFILAFLLKLSLQSVAAWPVGGIDVVMGGLDTALNFWMVAYLFLSIRVFFGVGWGYTSFVFIASSLLYSMLFFIGVFFFAALLFFFA